jgi:hypothetical protein
MTRPIDQSIPDILQATGELLNYFHALIDVSKISKVTKHSKHELNTKTTNHRAKQLTFQECTALVNVFSVLRSTGQEDQRGV